MSRVIINENVMRWAVARSVFSLEDLQHKFPKILQWVSGESQPTLKQIEALSKATRTPIGLFFLNEPPQDILPIPHFRTLADNGVYKHSPDLLETIQIMQRRQYWMRDFLIDEGQTEIPFVGSSTISDSPESIAENIRRALNLDIGWAARQPTWTEALRTLRETMEDVGILVFVNGIVGNNTHRKLNPSEFRGFVLADKFAPLVFVNGADGKAAQMFTLAHELAHVFLGSSAAFDLREMQPANNSTEKICNLAAAEFLIPGAKLKQIWNPNITTKESFQQIAKQFKVSIIVAARRALDLNLVTKDMYLDFYRDYQREERRVSSRQSSGGDFYLTQNMRVGRRFASTVVRAAKEGKLLFSEAYRLTGLYGKTFDKYAAEIWTR